MVGNKASQEKSEGSWVSADEAWLEGCGKQSGITNRVADKTHDPRRIHSHPYQIIVDLMTKRHLGGATHRFVLE